MRIIAKISSNNEFRLGCGENSSSRKRVTASDTADLVIARKIDLAVESKDYWDNTEYYKQLTDEYINTTYGSASRPRPQGEGGFNIIKKNQESNQDPVIEIKSLLEQNYLCLLQPCFYFNFKFSYWLYNWACYTFYRFLSRFERILNYLSTNISTDNTRVWGNPQKAKKLSRNARHILLEAGAIIDQYPLNWSRFLTLTLPTSAWSGFRAVANWSGFLINRLLQFLRDSKLDIASFFVWEFQTRGALHLHMLISALDEEIARKINRIAKRLRALWFQVLKDIEIKEKELGNKCDLFGRWRDKPKIWLKANIIQIPRKSVAAYLSKYASKGHADNIASMQKNNSHFYPSRWWGCTQNLKNLIKAKRFDFKLENASEAELKIIEKHLESILDTALMDYQYRFELQLGSGRNIWYQQKIYYFPPKNWAFIWQILKDLFTQVRYFQDLKNRVWAQGFHAYRKEDILFSGLLGDSISVIKNHEHRGMVEYKFADAAGSNLDLFEDLLQNLISN